MILSKIDFLFRAFVSEHDSDPIEWHVWYEGLDGPINGQRPAMDSLTEDITNFDLRDYMDDLDPDKCYQVYGSGTLVYTYSDATQEHDVELIINRDTVKTSWDY